jgi:ribulose-5-phosphate 4-epimerase/fuculose-1-phosphate aldolase
MIRPSAQDDREWQLRVDLAAAYRLTARYGLDDLVQTHISVRIPGPERHFLINPFGLLFHEVTASSLLRIDLDGRLVAPSPYPFNPAGFVIHSAIHAAREDAACVMHSHTEAGIIVATQAEGLLPLCQWAMLFHDRLGYHDYEGVALESGERERLVADLGAHPAMILRNHGLLTAGRTIQHAFYLMYYLDRACRIQIGALAGGRPLTLPPPEICEKAARQFEDDPVPLGDREWPALLRALDRDNPGYQL